MDGENNGKPYFLMDDFGVPTFTASRKSISDVVPVKPWDVRARRWEL